MRKCERCGSIYVCWNWIHWQKKLGHIPYADHEEDWGHECWACDSVQETLTKVTDGIPYWLLKICRKLHLIPDYDKIYRTIAFSADTKFIILEALGMKMDTKGYIVWKTPKPRQSKYVLSHRQKKVHIGNFHGIMKNYGIVTGDLPDLIDLADFIKEKQKNEARWRKPSKSKKSHR